MFYIGLLVGFVLGKIRISGYKKAILSKYFSKFYLVQRGLLAYFFEILALLIMLLVFSSKGLLVAGYLTGRFCFVFVHVFNQARYKL